MTRVVNLIIAATLTALLSACGGGGGGPAAPAPAPTSTTYTSVAAAGELITYTVDTTNLSYSYTIIESQFGLTNKTGSGTLTRLGDGTYTASNAGNGRVAILPNGLLVASVRENFGGVVQTVPVIGFSNPVTSASAAAGTYNFVQRSCIGASCGQGRGTFVLRSDGTWTSCGSANINLGGCASTSNGTYTSLGDGRFRIIDGNGSVNIGTAIAFNSNGQNVMILDLKDSRPAGFGVGIVVGSQQQALVAGAVDGIWVAIGTNGSHASFRVTGTNIQYLDVNGAPSNSTSSVTLNSPWAGMGTAASGGVGLLAGSGVYVLGSGASYAELGIKLR